MHTAHHMLIYGCEEPGSNEETWNCGEMAVRQPGLKTAAPCRAGAQVNLKFLPETLYVFIFSGVLVLLPRTFHCTMSLQGADVGC